MTTSHRWPLENLKCEPKFSIILSEKELPPEADCYVLTTPKRRQNFEPNIFMSDYAGPLDKLTRRNARNKGPGGSW